MKVADRVTTTGIYVGTYKAGSPEWWDARRGGLGGSEIAAVLGLSKWESRFSLWHRKAGEVGPSESNPEMEAGVRLEPAIVGKFADEHPELRVLPDKAMYRHIDRPWQLASPDALIYRADMAAGEDPIAVGEAKFALYDDEWGAEGTDEIPPYYLAQARWNMDALGLDLCYLEVFIGSSADFREYVIKADPADQEYVRGRAEEFLGTLARGERPSIDAHEATYEVIREMHPLIEDTSVEIAPTLRDSYRLACTELDTAKKNKRWAVSLVLDAMGNARRAVCQREEIAIRVAQYEDALPHLRPSRKRKAL